MEDDFVDEENPYNEAGREDLLENEEIDSSEEGFLKGYDDEEEKPKDKDGVESAEDEEKLKD